MSIELKKEALTLNEIIDHIGCEAFAEADIIVPDVKPDIDHILQIDVNPVIMEKSLMNEKIVFDCRLDICILYVSDNGLVKSINTGHNFSHQVINKSIAPGLFAECSCALTRLDHRLINSRKLSVNTTIGFDISIRKEQNTMLPVGVSGENDCQAQYTPVKIYVPNRQTVGEIAVREALEVPMGKPDVDEILKFDIKMCNKDIRIAGNKAIIKADLICSTLYTCDMDPSVLHHIEHEVGVTDVLDVPMGDDSQRCSVDFVNKIINYSIKQDGDGDNRIIMLEAYIDAVVDSGSNLEMEVMTDAYSKSCLLNLTKKEIPLEQVISEFKAQETFKATAELSENQPVIDRIYNITATPLTVNTKVENGKAIVDGDINIDVLYKSDDDDMPVNSFVYTMPFSRLFDYENNDEQCAFDVNVEVDNIGYTLSMGGEVNLRCVLSINMSVLKNYVLDYIDKIEEKADPEQKTNKHYCIRIYFVQKGDSLWKIAKQYRIPLEELMSANNLTAESVIYPGQQIIIP